MLWYSVHFKELYLCLRWTVFYLCSSPFLSTCLLHFSFLTKILLREITSSLTTAIKVPSNLKTFINLVSEKVNFAQTHSVFSYKSPIHNLTWLCSVSSNRAFRFAVHHGPVRVLIHTGLSGHKHGCSSRNAHIMWLMQSHEYAHTATEEWFR